MTTLSLFDLSQSPEIVIGETEHRRLTVAALTDIGGSTDRIDFLLYELDRARIVPDAALPPDVVRIGSIVRYQPLPETERTIKLVLPGDEKLAGDYRLSVTSDHGAALLGLRPGQIMTWLDANDAVRRLRVLRVANTPPHGSDPGPSAA